jgi:fructokinase
MNNEEAAPVMGTGFVVLDRLFVDGVEVGAWVGGSCGNVLMSLAALGHAVSPVIALGADNVGAQILTEFESEGASSEFVRLAEDRSSPILIQRTCSKNGQHHYAFRSPETGAPLPRYEPIDVEDFRKSLSQLSRCRVFYADRVSPVIMEAMQVVRATGGLVFFEPSNAKAQDLLTAAIAVAHVVKVAADRIDPDLLIQHAGPDTMAIVTHGAEGLEVRCGHARNWYPACHAPTVMDTSGAGDMVSAAVIDTFLATHSDGAWGTVVSTNLHRGVRAGQRLAAANCAFAGARGIFRETGRAVAKSILATT